MEEITDETRLREIITEPVRAVAAKAVDRVDVESRRFLEASPFLLLATTGPEGATDVSPRGDPPGRVLVLDDGRLAVSGPVPDLAIVSRSRSCSCTARRRSCGRRCGTP